MNLLGRVSSLWNALWFTPASPYPVAAFRIALGIYLLFYLGSMLPHVELLFSNRGVYAPYLVPDYAPPPIIAHCAFWALLISTLALTLGYRSTIFALLVLALFLYHYFLQLAVKQSSFERLAVIYLLVLACSSDRGVWSLSPVGGPPATSWTRRVLLLQTIALYFGAGLWKLLNSNWHTGRLLEATLQGMWATPLGFWLTRQGWSDSTWTALSWSIITFELLLGLAFLWRRTRVPAVCAGALFHLANATILAIPEFLVCLVPYPLFLPEQFVRHTGEKLERTMARAAARIGRGTPPERAL